MPLLYRADGREMKKGPEINQEHCVSMSASLSVGLCSSRASMYDVLSGNEVFIAVVKDHIERWSESWPL